MSEDRAKPFSKDWCQGFCRSCGTGCRQYCEQIHELQNQVQELESRNAKLRDALDFIGHECMHSHDNCPTREHMQIKAREVLQSTPSHAHEEWKAMKDVCEAAKQVLIRVLLGVYDDREKSCMIKSLRESLDALEKVRKSINENKNDE